MNLRPDLEELIFRAAVPFEERAIQVFRYQARECPPYRRFIDALGVNADSVEKFEDIPHMPIGVFKEVEVSTIPVVQIPLRFRSSATGGMRSSHWVANPDLYRRSLIEGFRDAYGDGPYQIWSYTPGYSDNPDSSLIWMIDALMESERCAYAYRHPLEKPLNIDEVLEQSKSEAPIIMIGAAFGLLDLIDLGIRGKVPPGTIIMETGGMKTRRRERTRAELHHELSDGFGLPLEQIHSEYGMAEMLSQAYGKSGDGRTEDGGRKTEERTEDEVKEKERKRKEEVKGEEVKGERGRFGFRLPHWAKISSTPQLINSSILSSRSYITDLANLYSCSFLVSGDRYELFEDGSFEVLGRVDPTDYRGCNFLMERD